MARVEGPRERKKSVKRESGNCAQGLHTRCFNLECSCQCHLCEEA